MVRFAGNFADHLLPCLGRFQVSRLRLRESSTASDAKPLRQIVCGAAHRLCRICDQQAAPKLFDVLMQNQTQLREELPDLGVIVGGKSLRA